MKCVLFLLVIMMPFQLIAQPTKVYRYQERGIIRQGDKLRTPDGDTLTIISMNWKRISKEDFVFAKVYFEGEEIEINLTQWIVQDKILYPGVMTKDDIEKAFPKP